MLHKEDHRTFQQEEKKNRTQKEKTTTILIANWNHGKNRQASSVSTRIQCSSYV